MTACARRPRHASRLAQPPPKRARNGSRRSDLTCGGGKPPLARNPPSADPVPVDPDRTRALPQRPDSLPLPLPGEVTISAEWAARLSPPLAFYDIGPHDDEWANRPPAERAQPCPIPLPPARRPARSRGAPRSTRGALRKCAAP